MWSKVSNYKWKHSNGVIILKYRIAGVYYYLLYQCGDDLEYGDFKTFDTLTSAKQ